MQRGIFPFGSSFFPSPFPFLYLNGQLRSDSSSSSNEEGLEFDSSRVFFLTSLLLLQSGGAMDLSKVGEKIFSSVRSARSLGFLPSTSDRPEVPARAAAAAAVARALASLPPNQRLSLPSCSEELRFMYGSRALEHPVEELEEEFYEEEFDAVIYVLDQIPDEDNEMEYFEKMATVRLAQLENITECLSQHLMERHEEMVKGMLLVRELERDLKIATVISMNGRRHLTSSLSEVSRDLIVTSKSKRKQALLEMLPVLSELCHALDMQKALERHAEEGNFCKAFQVLSEYLQLLDSLSDLSAVQEMSRGVEVWLGTVLQKLDALLLQVCQEFVQDKYITVIDAYALIGDAAGLGEKIQSFFMQEVLLETHSVLKVLVQEDEDLQSSQNCSRLTYSDLCMCVPESKIRVCLLRTLTVLFKLMCSYHAIMSFETENKAWDSTEKQHDSCTLSDAQPGLMSESCDSKGVNGSHTSSVTRQQNSSSVKECANTVSANNPLETISVHSNDSTSEAINEANAASSSGSPWYELRRDATAIVSQALERGRRNLWQLTTSRVSVLLSSTAFSSTSIHQFLKNYEDLDVFILVGEAFCGVEASEFKSKVKAACENYFRSFHRQNIHAFKMVLERENWQILPQDATLMVSFAGLIGDGAPLLTSSNDINRHLHHSNKLADSVGMGMKKTGFSQWIENGNPFIPKVTSPSGNYSTSPFVDSSGETHRKSANPPESDKISPRNSDADQLNGNSRISEDETEDLLADFIDEDSQRPSWNAGRSLSRKHSLQWRDNEAASQTGSSLCLLRFMDKYARFMQKLELANVVFFKGICQFFEVYYQFIYEDFGQQTGIPNGTGADSVNFRVRSALKRITQECDLWSKPQMLHASSSLPTPLNASLKLTDVMPVSPPNTSFGLKERCTCADTISLIASILHRSKSHLQSMLLQHNASIVEDFFTNVVDSVPYLVEHIHKTTARLLLHISGYVDRIAAAKWELKDLGMEHNGYVDLLLGEFKHYKTRLAHGGIRKEVQDALLEYGVEIVAETLIEGLSRVKRCTDEGRALMSLDLQVLINGLQHFVSKDIKPKLQGVDVFVKAYYLSETEYIHWARAHPEYTKAQVVGLVNLVATMKGWKRKTRLEILEKIE
ncbi:hypothetical protein V2J09_002745 [Rumex salicifolius]